MLPLTISNDSNPIDKKDSNFVMLKHLLNNKSKFNIIIEGNIGAGKSTLLQYFEKIGTAEVLTFKEPLQNGQISTAQICLN